ncbi:MAG: hypothetical protein C4522_17870 [Desulfobacteraceae bacterium]|nr:MAG: hypothetical protein C4522_17870 [Desulfobacteraceae bacterium]
MEIPIATAVSIREAGFDEYWLRDLIYENPTCLGLGDIESVSKERIQSSGGRLDILLKNPEDDSMYEVEIMLGETDESHIIRTIEYWDNEKRRWPQRQHYAVLVAEGITRRFFNVIQLMSQTIPIIAVQVNLIESAGQKSLHFSKILDTYEEPDDGTSDGEIYDETFWRKKAPWAIEAARALLEVVGDLFDSPTVRFVKNYVAFTVLGNNFFWFHKRSAGKSLFGFRISDEHLDEVAQLLDVQNISFVQKRNRFKFTCDAEFIQKNKELLRQIADFVKKAWQK